MIDVMYIYVLYKTRINTEMVGWLYTVFTYLVLTLRTGMTLDCSGITDKLLNQKIAASNELKNKRAPVKTKLPILPPLKSNSRDWE